MAGTPDAPKESKRPSRQVKHRHKRRELGLCGREGCRIRTGADYYCESHARENADYKKSKKLAAC